MPAHKYSKGKIGGDGNKNKGKPSKLMEKPV